LESLFGILKDHFNDHGYWTVALALLLENAGVPVPGESILLFASFLAYSQGTMQLRWIIPVAIVAAVLGDNLGYWLGLRGGRPLLERYQRFFRISPASLAKGERTFERFGALTVFLARFIFGLRVMAGPLAGVLKMPWRRFLLFNALGATVWVIVISVVGALFGRHWERVMEVMGEVNTGILVVAAVVVALLWWRYRFRKNS
jgi:membrane protein DedA with SNARE-associated domain